MMGHIDSAREKFYHLRFKALPKDKSLDLTKMKALADDIVINAAHT